MDAQGMVVFLALLFGATWVVAEAYVRRAHLRDAARLARAARSRRAAPPGKVERRIGLRLTSPPTASGPCR